MSTAKGFNPSKHPRRMAALRDQNIAERARALAPALCSPEIAKRLGISRIELEQIAARAGFAFRNHNER